MVGPFVAQGTQLEPPGLGVGRPAREDGRRCSLELQSRSGDCAVHYPPTEDETRGGGSGGRMCTRDNEIIPPPSPSFPLVSLLSFFLPPLGPTQGRREGTTTTTERRKRVLCTRYVVWFPSPPPMPLFLPFWAVSPLPATKLCSLGICHTEGKGGGEAYE